MGRAFGSMRKIKRAALILGIIWALLLGVGVTLVATTSEQPPPTEITAPVEILGASGCQTVWLAEPTYYNVLDTGTKRCLILPESGWAKVYRLDNPNLRLIDYHNPGYITTTPPNGGFGTPVANRVQWLADKYDVTIQFAKTDMAGREGCTSKFRGVSGTYSGTTKYGRGLIRLGTGSTKWCLVNRPAIVRNIALHEIAHAIAERKCKPYGGPRPENLADAYAYRYLGATSRSAGNYGFNRYDWARAYKVHKGRC